MITSKIVPEIDGLRVDEAHKGSSGGYTERPLSAQELAFIESQDKSLQQATEIAMKQYNLSDIDREYVSKIYRGDLDANDPRVIAEVQKRMSNLKPPSRADYTRSVKSGAASEEQIDGYIQSKRGLGFDENDGGFDRYSGATGRSLAKRELETQLKSTAQSTEFDEAGYQAALDSFNKFKGDITSSVADELGGAGVDELLFDAVKAFPSEANKLLTEWQTKAQSLGDTYTSTLTGISDTFKAKLTGASEAMGTADTDIYSTTKAQNLAGISQAYAEAQKQAEGALARRGLAGSGVQAGVTGTLYGQEAQTKAQALGQSYNQAIALSDQRRQQQIGIAGQIAQSDTSVAGSTYQTQLGTATSNLQNRLNANQQNMANLQMASGVSQGIFGQSANMLAGAGSTANQTASIAGNTAAQYGQMDNQYQMAQNAANDSGGLMGAVVSGGVGALTGGIGTGLGASLAKQWG